MTHPSFITQPEVLKQIRPDIWRQAYRNKWLHTAFKIAGVRIPEKDEEFTDSFWTELGKSFASFEVIKETAELVSFLNTIETFVQNDNPEVSAYVLERFGKRRRSMEDKGQETTEMSPPIKAVEAAATTFISACFENEMEVLEARLGRDPSAMHCYDFPKGYSYTSPSADTLRRAVARVRENRDKTKGRGFGRPFPMRYSAQILKEEADSAPVWIAIRYHHARLTRWDETRLGDKRKTFAETAPRYDILVIEPEFNRIRVDAASGPRLRAAQEFVEVLLFDSPPHQTQDADELFLVDDVVYTFSPLQRPDWENIMNPTGNSDMTGVRLSEVHCVDELEGGAYNMVFEARGGKDLARISSNTHRAFDKLSFGMITQVKFEFYFGHGSAPTEVTIKERNTIDFSSRSRKPLIMDWLKNAGFIVDKPQGIGVRYCLRKLWHGDTLSVIKSACGDELFNYLEREKLLKETKKVGSVCIRNGKLLDIRVTYDDNGQEIYQVLDSDIKRWQYADAAEVNKFVLKRDAFFNKLLDLPSWGTRSKLTALGNEAEEAYRVCDLRLFGVRPFFSLTASSQELSLIQNSAAGGTLSKKAVIITPTAELPADFAAIKNNFLHLTVDELLENKLKGDAQCPPINFHFRGRYAPLVESRSKYPYFPGAQFGDVTWRGCSIEILSDHELRLQMNGGKPQDFEKDALFFTDAEFNKELSINTFHILLCIAKSAEDAQQRWEDDLKSEGKQVSRAKAWSGEFRLSGNIVNEKGAADAIQTLNQALKATFLQTESCFEPLGELEYRCKMKVRFGADAKRRIAIAEADPTENLPEELTQKYDPSDIMTIGEACEGMGEDAMSVINRSPKRGKNPAKHSCKKQE